MRYMHVPAGKTYILAAFADIVKSNFPRCLLGGIPVRILYLQMLDSLEEKIWFEEVYQKYSDLMFQVADRILHNDQDVENAVHNAFLRLIKRFSKYQNMPAQDMAPLVAVIAKNEAISLQRKKRDGVVQEKWDAFAEPAEFVTDYHTLVETFTHLPQTYRAAIEMKMIGYSDGEIASKSGLSKTVVSARTSRGRCLLRDIVEQEGLRMDA